MSLAEMHALLEEMLQSATHNDASRVSMLDKRFEEIVQDVYPSVDKKVWLEYENCRQSCVLSFVMPLQRADFLKDAYARFERMQRPMP